MNTTPPAAKIMGCEHGVRVGMAENMLVLQKTGLHFPKNEARTLNISFKLERHQTNGKNKHED